MKHYLVWMYPRIVHSRIEICTTTSVPHINSGEYDIILLPQFVDPSNPFMCSIGHFILNIIDVKEKHVYIVNTLRGKAEGVQRRIIYIIWVQWSRCETIDKWHWLVIPVLLLHVSSSEVSLIDDKMGGHSSIWRRRVLRVVKGLINRFNKVKKQWLRWLRVDEENCN